MNQGSGGKIGLRKTIFAGGVGFLIASGAFVQPANAQSAADISRQVVNSAIQSVIQSIRDQIQHRKVPAATPSRALRFSADGNAKEAYYDEVFGALGYANSPMPTKAPAAAPASIPLMWGISGTGSLDRQRTTIAGLTTTSHTEAGVGTGDVTKIGVFNTSDAFVLGVNGSASITRSDGTEAKTDGVGVYTAYVNGGFSTDSAFNAARTDSTAAGITTDTRAYTYASNVQYKFDLPNAWWVEPTAGYSVTHTYFVDMPGAEVGKTTMVQGGARVGTEWMSNGVRVQPTFTGLAYSNVQETAGGIPVPVAVPNDKGQVWGKAAAKLNFVFSNNFSAFAEGSVRGTRGTVDATGYNGLVGARITF